MHNWSVCFLDSKYIVKNALTLWSSPTSPVITHIVRAYFWKNPFLNWGASFRIHFEKIRIRGFSGVLNPNPSGGFWLGVILTSFREVKGQNINVKVKRIKHGNTLFLVRFPGVLWYAESNSACKIMLKCHFDLILGSWRSKHQCQGQTY